MATKTTNFQCPACTGPLHFDSGTGGLLCDYCGSRYTVEEIEAQFSQQEKKTEQETAQKTQRTWETERMGEWGPDADRMLVYTCSSCGAELLCEKTTAATSCPYCGNPTVVPNQLSGALKPDYIIPFQQDRAAAMAALKKHYQKKFFLPKAFTEQNHLEKLQGVYVPFWLFDGTGDADIRFHATRSHFYRSGNYEVTETDHFSVRRAGTVPFSRVPVDGSSKMPDDYMDSIEPFRYEALRAFSMAYLPGFLADKYDVTAQESAQRARQRLLHSTKEVMREDVRGYETVTPTSTQVEIVPGAVHYALLPVWMLTTKWNGKTFLFAMNGQTGRLVGDLPVDWRKFWLTFGMMAALFGVILLLSGLPQWIARAILTLFG